MIAPGLRVRNRQANNSHASVISKHETDMQWLPFQRHRTGHRYLRGPGRNQSRLSEPAHRLNYYTWQTQGTMARSRSVTLQSIARPAAKSRPFVNRDGKTCSPQQDSSPPGPISAHTSPPTSRCRSREHFIYACVRLYERSPCRRCCLWSILEWRLAAHHALAVPITLA